MLKESLKKFLSSLISVFPIVLIVIVIYLLQLYTPIFPDGIISFDLLICFLLCSIFLVIGMSFFTLGSDIAMVQVGKYIGTSFAKSKKVILMIILMFLLGIMITIAEPSVSVLVGYIPAEDINPWIFKLFIGIGIGIFFVIGFLRVMFKKSLRLWLIFFYLIIFAIASLFGDEQGAIIDLSIDAGTAATGAITVPFIIAFGAGVAGTVGSDSSNDSFGLVGLCCVGPVIVVMLMGLVLKPEITSIVINSEISLSRFTSIFVSSISSVCFAIIPIVIFFVVYDLIAIKLPKNEMLKIFLGFLYTAVGLVIFLTAANFGFIPLGNALGSGLGALKDYHLVLIILSLIIGFVIVLVEPSVQILTQQVEEISNGSITRKKLTLSLSISVSIAVLLATIRVLYFPDLSLLYYMVPLYVLACFLSLFVSDIYVGIAFDAGGVVSGTMASCFVLPFILGIGNSLGSKANGFGVIGLIAAMPLLIVQGLGVEAKVRVAIMQKNARKRVREKDDNQIIHFNKEVNI